MSASQKRCAPPGEGFRPRPCAGRHPRQGGTPMPPELARTTWGWVSLTTPEETLTIAVSPT
jgi:hypothetical protein